MANIRISDDLDLVLRDAAHRAGRTKDELAQDILMAHLEDEPLSLSALTAGQVARLKEGAAQLDRGEFVTSEQVDEKFEAFFNRLAAR